MARIRHVGGTITEKTEGNEIYFFEGDIVINAVGNITITSTNGIIFEVPESPNVTVIESEYKIESTYAHN